MTLLRLITLFLLWPVAVLAQSFDDVITTELRAGWRLSNGTHMAALHLSLAPGWKTYWRAPGDAGIPPEFSWSGARNIDRVEVLWPAPHVFFQSGMRSVGYKQDVILPLRIFPTQPGQDARIGGTIDIGICKEICIPHRVRVQIALPATAAKPDPMIAAAMADLPLSAAEAGLAATSCQFEPTQNGLILNAAIPAKGHWDLVVETNNPEVWVAEPETRRQGDMLYAQTTMRHSSGGAFALNRSALRFTLLGTQGAIDIQGCKS